MNKRRLQVTLLFLFTAGVSYAQDSAGVKYSSAYQVLYGVQQKKKSTASISEIYSTDIQKTVSTSYAGMLTGRMAGLYSLQFSGEPGADFPALVLRGQAPFVMIDGTPRSYNSINPEQIESVTLLKDAVSTAMAGMRASSGILLITTKKGQESAPVIQFNAMAGTQRPTKLPKFLNAYDYARLYNEALANDGKAPVYTQADLDAYQNGSDPIGHPDVDWQKEVLNKQASISRYDLSISGGSPTVHYFADLDYLNQQGLLKKSPTTVYNTAAEYKRYIFRTNVSVDLNKAFNAFLNVFTRVQNFNEPGATTPGIFGNFLNTPNSAYNILNTDGSLGGNREYQNNMYGQAFRSGYRPSYSRDFNVDLGLKAKLGKGFWIKGMASINAYLLESTNRSKALVIFQQKGTTGTPEYQQFGTTSDQANTVTVGSQNRRFYTEVSGGYSKEIGKHNIDAVIVASNDNNFENTDLDYNYRGISGKISYSYDQKYLAEVAVAYNSNDRFPQGRRYGTFPAIGLGWNISRESFMRHRPSWMNELKIRASVGKTGNADPRYYAYNQYYTAGSGYNFGETVTSVSGVQQGALANPYLTWEKALKINGGIDASFFNNKLVFNLDYFNNRLYDLLQPRGQSSEILGNTYPDQNIGVNRYSGFELQLTYQNKIGAFSYFISPNASTLKTTVVFQDEVNRAYDWMRRTGQPVGQPFGYVAEGLFQSVTEINSSAKPAGMILVPGDIKYKDLNKDGVIDASDQTAIGNKKPVFYYGVNLGGSWKGFDLTVLLQGVQNINIYRAGDSYWEFDDNGKGQAYAHHLNRWTPGNAANATYPRLTVGNNLNSSQFSSYWIQSGSYMRVKNIELGYSFSTKLIKHAGLSGARLFLNGTNLFTITSLKDADPENPSYNYPIQKVLVAGVTLKF
jgi:TonB-linked SusC/RagA family outer membrane protein